MLCFQTVIKEDLPRKAKTLSSDSDKLLKEAKLTQKKLRQGIGAWRGRGGWGSQGFENVLLRPGKTANSGSKCVIYLIDLMFPPNILTYTKLTRTS